MAVRSPGWALLVTATVVASALAVSAEEAATPTPIEPTPAPEPPGPHRPEPPRVPLPPKPDFGAAQAAEQAKVAADAPAPAGGEATPAPPPPPPDLGQLPYLAPGLAGTAPELSLEVDADARITADPRVQRGLYRVEFAGQEENLGTQIARARIDGLQSFAVVRLGPSEQRLDLRVDPRVRGVRVDRVSGTQVVFRFLDRPVRAALSEVPDDGIGGADAALGYAPASQDPEADQALLSLLLAPAERSPDWVEWGPLLWPIGPASPVPLRVHIDLRPRPVPPPSTEALAGWKDDPILVAAADIRPERGSRGGKAAAFRMRGYSARDDRDRARFALARAWAWIQADEDGEPLDAGRASEAASLAANLEPEAPWVSWAEGLAGYGWEREHRLPEARYHYEKAIRLAKTPEERAAWALRLAMVRVVDGEPGEGAIALAAALGRLPQIDEALRFEARRAVAVAMWKAGDGARAAALVDMLRREHPVLASKPLNDESWGGIYLQSGRAATALPFLQRMARESRTSLRRQRARWWLHEAAVMLQDGDAARRSLLDLVTESPKSVLVPLAKNRMLVLEHVLGAKQGGAGRADLIQSLERAALRWPDTPVAHEALWLVGQLYMSLDLLEDGLHVYRWLEERSPGSAAAFEEVVCRYAPRAFDILRARGEETRALGVYRTFLDDPRLHLCATPEGREDAAAVAMSAGLPDLGARWLGQAIAGGSDPGLSARHLLKLAELYVAGGKTEAARQTIRYLSSQRLPLRPGDLESADGDIATAEGRWQDALDAYDQAIVAMMGTVRTAAYIPTMVWRRGVALHQLGRKAEALQSYARAVEAGGAPHAGNGWATVASLAASMARSPEDWEQVLRACDRARQEGTDESLRQSVAWLRAEALTALGRAEEGQEAVTSIGEEEDVWGIMARHRAASRAFDASMREALGRFAKKDR